jgi:hypothetical protein
MQSEERARVQSGQDGHSERGGCGAGPAATRRARGRGFTGNRTDRQWFLAVPLLTGSSAYAVAEAFGWKHGFDKHPSRAKELYWLIAVSTLLGMLVNFAGVNPLKALFMSAGINGFLALPLLILILKISNDRKIMGDRVNGAFLNFLGPPSI